MLAAHSASPAHAGSEVTLDAADVIACAEEEADLRLCAPDPICDPGWAFFHRQACAEEAEAAIGEAVAHFRARLLPVLADLDPEGGYTAAEDAAHAAWLAYRDANCAPDRTARLDVTGADEARAYCRIAHAMRRLEVVRADLDRFEFKRAAAR